MKAGVVWRLRSLTKPWCRPCLSRCLRRLASIHRQPFGRYPSPGYSIIKGTMTPLKPSGECYTCAKCGKTKPQVDFHRHPQTDRHRPVHSHCKQCRKTKGIETECIGCLSLSRLDANGLCRGCNALGGLQCCRTCGDLKLGIDFYPGRRVCKRCYLGGNHTGKP